MDGVDVRINTGVALGNGADMGISDSMGDKAKDMMSGNEDKVDDAVKKAGDKADDATGNKYSDQIDKGEDAASDAIKNLKK